MKTMFAVLIFLCLAGSAAARRITFGEALKAHQLEFSVKAVYNHGRPMQLSMQNTADEDLEVELEAGRIFYADGTACQPFVVTRPAVVALQRKERKVSWHHARCGNSSAPAPAASVTFTRTAMGAPELVATLNNMNELRISSSSLYQAVVWHYTNQHAISAIHARDVSEPLLKAVVTDICQREHKVPSWYFMEYAPPGSGHELEFSGIPSRMGAKLELLLARESDLQVQVRDEQGSIVRIVKVYLRQAPGACTLPLDLDVKGWPNGNYRLCVVNQDQRALLEREFTI
ncbi:MAG: hypothetical protein JNL88_12290 [Bacteroidia bacterium]|nr:hypothetical protein [Bacteroidia bacterium]